MRFTRGVVRVPVKVLYVSLIVLSTSFFLYLYILKYQRIGSYDRCGYASTPKRPPTSKGAHGKGSQNRSACWLEPRATKVEDCPQCFRPNVKNISEKLFQISYNVSLFPRGPPGLFTLKNVVQQDYIQDYLITPRSVCVDNCPYLIAVLLSISDDLDQRNAIRSTWGSVAKTRLWPNVEINADFQILFVLAHKTPDSYIRYNENQAPKKYMETEHFPTMNEWGYIKTEADIYGDILYLNMQDSYYNLTLKLVSAFKWVAQHCPRAKFVLKVDVDTFVNVPLLLDLLIYNEARLEFSLMGKMYLEGRIVLRETKWAVDRNVYPPAIFPVYASESAYVLSWRLLRRIIDICPFLPLADIVQKTVHDSNGPGVLFITGYLGTILAFDYYSLGPNVFTHNLETQWFWCDMIHDQKIAGLIIEEVDMYKLWRSFFRFYGKCWKEIPKLANPNND